MDGDVDVVQQMGPALGEMRWDVDINLTNNKHAKGEKVQAMLQATGETSRVERESKQARLLLPPGEERKGEEGRRRGERREEKGGREA